jgi:phage tail-like protein
VNSGNVNQKPIDPFGSFNFRVEIEGLLVGGFSECTGLEIDIEIEEYREGGLNDYVHGFAGRAKYPALVLKRGLTISDTLWTWHQDVINGQFTRKNGTIYLLNTQRVPTIWWNFRNAIPTKWSGPSLRAAASELAVESIELVHQGLIRRQG